MAWPLELTVEINDREFKRYFRRALIRMKDLRPALRKCSIIMLRSFADNFTQEGRPKKWPSLAPTTIAKRRKQSSKILQDTGRLRLSVLSRNAPGNIFDLKRYSLAMGSNLIISEWHQYGVKPHVITPKEKPSLAIPLPEGLILTKKVNHPGIAARPFVLIQDSDTKEMIKIFRDYSLGE